MHAAREQSFRFRKDLGLPNQVCLFRWAQYSEAVGGVQMERGLPHPSTEDDELQRGVQLDFWGRRRLTTYIAESTVLSQPA